MITRHRQRYKYWFRLIIFIVTISFVLQSIAGAVPILKPETLAPESEFARLASRIDIQMASVGYGFIQWIKGANIRGIKQLEALLVRNPDIRKDLFHIDVNTIFYPDRIELIGPKFTLVFIDSNKYPEAGFYKIPGTNIRMDLYKHPRALLKPPLKPQILDGKSIDSKVSTGSDLNENRGQSSTLENLRIEKRYLVLNNPDEMSRYAAEYFINEVKRLIKEKGKAVICLPTGNTPKKMYRIIREEYKDAVDWSKVIVFHLDEYVFPIKKYPLWKYPYSYRYFLQEELLKYLPIPEENIHFLGDIDPNEEYSIGKYRTEIESTGGIDLCILGIGKNGHIAFNEPGSSFNSSIRKVRLKFSTRWANRKAFGKWYQFWRLFKVPRYAFTLGIEEIMASKKIMLLATGKEKTRAVQNSIFGPVTEEVPASILQRHPDVRYFLDKEAFGLNKDADQIEEIGYRIFMHIPRISLFGKIFNPNWWRDRTMYLGMRLWIRKWLMNMIDRYPTLPFYKKIPLFWFGLGMHFIAQRFIAGDTVEEVIKNILRLKNNGLDYTVDILGEEVTDEKTAEENMNRYIRLLEELTGFAGPVNLSLKLTSLVSQLDEEHKEIVKQRLRKILRKAKELGAFVTIDMEQYCYKDLTLKIYKEILEEPEFQNCSNLQIVIQCYLKDSPRDIEELIEWAKNRYEHTGARVLVRLVKGAYWDKEVQWAREEGRPIPVWAQKWQTDKNYEEMASLLLENHEYIQTAFATHNVRSMSRVIYEAKRNNIPGDKIEFQMLYGMGEPFQDSLLRMGYRVRLYIPFGPLLNGLKYFSRRITENTSQESFLLQSLSGKYKPSELLKEPGPSPVDYRKGFNHALERLLKLHPEDFIPYPLMDELKKINGGKTPKCYSFDSPDRLRRFMRWGYLLRFIKPDELIIVRLILPEKYGKSLIISALRFKDLIEKIKWEKTYFFTKRYFNTKDCVIKGEGLYLSDELRGKGLGSSAFRLFVRRLVESGFGGYPFKAKIKNPKLLHLIYEELDGRIDTNGDKQTEDPRTTLAKLVNWYSQGVDLGWEKLIIPVEGIVPGIGEPRTPKERFEEMLSSSDMLKAYIEDRRIYELVPEWEDWVRLYENSNFKRYHHLSPQEHLVLAFERLESNYFWKIVKEYKLRGSGVGHIRRALFLHDFGKILALQEDPGYSHTTHKKHPEFSMKMAKGILKRLGYSDVEIEDDLFLIRYHEVLKDLAEFGEAELQPLEFVNLLKNTWRLRLLKVLQLVDASSVRHKLENSLSIGLEWRINEITGLIEDILNASGEKRREHERRFLDYLEDIKRQNNEIRLAFSRFKGVLQRHLIKIDEKILNDAFLAMHRSHMGLLRKDGRTPYAIHPIEVATILVDELGVRDPNWIISALLHDVLEDTRTTKESIELIFGGEVSSIVRLLSKPDISRYASKDEREIDFYHRIIYGADGISDRNILTAAQTIKIADRIDNLRTLTSDIAEKQINETYEVFLHYFLGETEVSVDIKRRLIDELIGHGKRWKVLSSEQIAELKVLSNEIIEFRIPELTVEVSPYNFIRGLVEYWQKERLTGPLILAFNGMSGVGRSLFTEELQKKFQGIGKKVVVFDLNDYLLPRTERDRVLQEVEQSGIPFYEQRERFYDMERFKREVWNRLKGFKESTSHRLRFRLSRLYNRLTGRLDATKEYEIDRDTIVLIEGAHIFQENLLPLYDATFFVHAPREVCLENVIERERGKPPEYQQSPQLISKRFELIDWPSYRKHLLSYWRLSGFVIDNTDYRRPLLKKNPFPRYPQRVPNVPKEFTSSEGRLNRNLEGIFRQLKDRGLNPNDIVGPMDNISIFKVILAVKGVQQLLPSIPPNSEIDTLDYFLDQLLAKKTDLVNLFIELVVNYLEKLECLPKIICSSSFPQDLLLRILSKRKWEEAKFNSNYILYRSNGLYIEVPRVGRISIGDQERQFVYRHFLLRFIYRLLNKYNHIRWVRRFRELLKLFLHYFKPQRIISGEYMKVYKLILAKAPHLITPTRIIEDERLWEKIGLEGMARQNKALILQMVEGELLVDYVSKLVRNGAWDEVEKILEDAFNFLQGLWLYGIADLDPDINIWENLVVIDGKIKTCNAEHITNDLSKVRDYCKKKIEESKNPDSFGNVKKLLVDRFGKQDAERLMKMFLDKIAERFDIQEYPWEKDRSLKGSPKGSPAECLRALFNGMHFEDNPITLKDLMQKRINPKTRRPFDKKTIRVELKSLILLGLVIKDGNRFYLSSMLRFVSPEVIEGICNITLDKPSPRRSKRLRNSPPLLHYNEILKLSSEEIDEFMKKIAHILGITQSVNPLTGHTIIKDKEGRILEILDRYGNSIERYHYTWTDFLLQTFVTLHNIKPNSRFKYIDLAWVRFLGVHRIKVIVNNKSIGAIDCQYSDNEMIIRGFYPLDFEKEEFRQYAMEGIGGTIFNWLMLIAKRNGIERIRMLTDNPIFLWMGAKYMQNITIEWGERCVIRSLKDAVDLISNHMIVNVEGEPNPIYITVAPEGITYLRGDILEESVAKQLPKIIKFFTEKVRSLVNAQGDLVELERPENQQPERARIAKILRRYAGDVSQDKITQSMAWHVLEGLGMNKDFKGKIVYTLKALLEGDLRDNKEKINELVRSTEGRVLFYTGNGCLIAPGYEIPKDRLVTIDKVTELRDNNQLIVFMVEDIDRKQLGLEDLTPGKLMGNQFWIPINGYRHTLSDISLGLEVMRVNGNISNMPSLFKLLLIEAIRDWLVGNRQMPTEERIQEILGIEIPPNKGDYLEEIEQSYTILLSA